MEVSLLFGTETGNAEMLCDDLQEQLEGDYNFEIANLEDVEPHELDTNRFHIFVCSTYGEGELPQSAIPFVDKLRATEPDLSALRFAIFGLGDTVYEETFANGSVVLMEALIRAKATVIGERGIHDASGRTDAIDIALPWAKDRLSEAKTG